ncbi:MAG: tetratricopeptide repeat protein, partial [Anaerolineales bacterium]|nr:tetratricopeptide repeat protein [Anaerolineales bacterium]
QADPTNARVLRSLSEAYNAAGLTEDAFETAQTALSLAPAEVDSLVWFADQVETLLAKPGFNIREAQTEVLNALATATQIEPQRTDLWVRLGQTHLKNGDSQAAIKAFRTIADIHNPNSSSLAADLYQAAHGLMDLEDAGSAVTCLERALQPDYTPISPSDPSLLEILTALSTANFQNGDSKAALESLNQAIMVAPDESPLYIDKADLLLEAGDAGQREETNISEALSCLETALQLNPNDPNSHYRAALIRRTTGDIPAALDHAEQLISLSSDSVEESLTCRTLAAELALAMLRPELARSYLDYKEPEREISDHVTHLEFHYLQAELAMDAREDHIAVNQLVKILEAAPEEPRVLAIQARLSIKRGDYHAAVATFNSAYEAIGEPSNAPVSSLRPLAQTALETRQWDKSIELLKQIVKKAPLEPLSHISLARAVVLRAEYERLCQALDAVHRAPGESSLDEDTHRDFEVNILEAEEQIDRWEEQLQESGKSKGELETSQKSINRWRARGKAIFEPSPESAQALAEMPQQTPGDIAALVACLRQTGELKAAGMAAREHPQNPLVLIQLALALGEDKPRQALSAVQAASDSTRRPKGHYQSGSTGINIETEPFILALQARHFHIHGQSFEDQANALKSIQTALTIWPNEPRWHVLAAEIHLSENTVNKLTNFEAAIPHLEQAIKLEPGYAPPYLTLGQIYLQEGSIQQAIHTIEGAADLVPEQATPWILLAKAHLTAGDLDQAGAYAERAVTLSPNQVEPLLLRGEIDLKANNPSGAQSRAQAALRINPDDMAAMSMMAHALSELGRPEEALSLVEIALQSTPDSLALSLEKVRIIDKTKGQSPALQAINELKERYPEEPVILAFLAEALDEAGENEKAIQAAQSALRGNSDQEQLTLGEQAKLHYLLGCSFRRSGQLDQAVHHLSEARRLSPEMADIYLELGQTHEERRQHDQALNIYQQAIAAIPNDYRAYYQTGIALKESKDYQGAEKMLRQAAELAPNEPGIHRMLAAVVALNLVHNFREEVPHDMQVSA